MSEINKNKQHPSGPNNLDTATPILGLSHNCFHSPVYSLDRFHSNNSQNESVNLSLISFEVLDIKKKK